MGLFKRKKQEEPLVLDLESEQVADVIDSNDVRETLKKIWQGARQNPCPEIMQATGTCYCPGCENIGKCAVERMSRSVGCVGSFPVYCSTKDAKRGEPTYGWGHIVLRNIMGEVNAKYGIPDTEGTKNAKKKVTGDLKRRTKRSDDSIT